MKKGIFILALLLVSLLALPFAEAYYGSSPQIRATLTSQSPDPVEPGEVFTATFKVENEGDDTNFPVTARIIPEFPFQSYGATEKNIGVLRSLSTAGDAIIVEFDVKVDPNAVEGEYNLNFEVDLGDGSIAYFDDEMLIDVETRDPILEITSIETSTDRVAPGLNAEVNIMVKNTDDTLLRDIVLSLDLNGDDVPFAPYQSTSERRISVLESGFQKAVTFNVIAEPDANDGLYKIPITITFTDEKGNEETVDDVIALSIGKEQQLRAYVRRTEVFKAGQEGVVTIGLANSNTGNINYLEMEILPSDNFELLSSTNYFYIGDLDADDTESEEIQIYVNKRAKDLSIPLRISYTDDNNRQYQEEFELDLKLYRGGDLVKYGFEQSKTRGILTFLTFLAIAIVGWIWWKNRKKKSKQ